MSKYLHKSPLSHICTNHSLRHIHSVNIWRCTSNSDLAITWFGAMPPWDTRFTHWFPVCFVGSNRGSCRRAIKPDYKCQMHGQYRMYMDLLNRLKNWCLIWSSLLILPLTVFLYMLEVRHSHTHTHTVFLYMLEVRHAHTHTHAHTRAHTHTVFLYMLEVRHSHTQCSSTCWRYVTHAHTHTHTHTVFLYMLEVRHAHTHTHSVPLHAGGTSRTHTHTHTVFLYMLEVHHSLSLTHTHTHTPCSSICWRYVTHTHTHTHSVPLHAWGT